MGCMDGFTTRRKGHPDHLWVSHTDHEPLHPHFESNQTFVPRFVPHHFPLLFPVISAVISYKDRAVTLNNQSLRTLHFSNVIFILRNIFLCVFAGNVVGTNITESDSTANVTSQLSEEEGPVKVSEVTVAVTGMSSSARADTLNTVTPRAGRIPRAGEDEEQSSGMFGETVAPTVEEVSVATTPQLSPDSAETEHLLPSNPRTNVKEGESQEEEDEERLAHSDPPWIHVKDTAVLDLDDLATTTSPPSIATSPSNPDVLHVDFFDPSSRGHNLNLAPPSPSSLAHELQGGDPTSWAMPTEYDYLTPYEDGMSPTADEYPYSTTTDTYEPGSPVRSMPWVPGVGRPGVGAPVPNTPVEAPAPALPVDGSDGLGGCRVGYQMVNGSCRSPCDMLPNYCFNGGQCYLLEGMGVFCRCETT